LTVYNNFLPSPVPPPAGPTVYLYDARVVPSSLPGTDGVTLDAWTISQTASGQPRLTLTLQGAGTGVTQYASVYVRKVAAGLPQAFPALVFSNDDNLGSSTPVGFSVVIDEVLGLVTSSHNLSAAPASSDQSNYGVHNFSASFWLIWVSIADDGTSKEFTVDPYPASYGALASGSLIGSIPQSSRADFTKIAVSTTHP
jgi:hypothetical protein